MSALGRLARGLRARRVIGVVGLARIVVWSVVIEIGLRVASLPRLAQFAGVTLDVRSPAYADPGRRQAVPLTAAERQGVDDARRVLRLGPFADTCLRRALLVGHVLRSHDPALHIGVAKSDGQVAAHAWLVVGGVNLDPTGSARFDAVVPVTREVTAG